MKFGTKEWAEHSRNIYIGCQNDCKYCYARYNWCNRWKKRKPEEWKNMTFNRNNFNKKPKKLDGRIMYPTSHDIFPETLDKTIKYLIKWLEEENEILITTKPRLNCVGPMLDELKRYKDQITWRFTITSADEEVIKFWEPDAPSFKERLAVLEHTYNRGWRTSVSCEPYLDMTIKPLVYICLKSITDTVWIGKMNFMEQRVDTTNWKKEDFKFIDMVKMSQTDDYVKELYEEFRNNPKVRWKESCKKVLGLEDEPVG